MLRKNVSGQHIGLVLVKASDGTALTGATVSAFRVIDGGTQIAATGTVTEGALANGQYSFAPSQADTNGNQISYLFTASTAVPTEKTVVTTAADPTDAMGFGLTRLDAAVSSRSTYAGADTAGTTTILAALAPYGGLLLAATVSAATSAASFTLAFDEAVVAANLVGLQVCFKTGPNLPQKGTITGGPTQVDSTHVLVTFAANTFTSTPGVGDTAEVG